jgi:hypothetical protein
MIQMINLKMMKIQKILLGMHQIIQQKKMMIHRKKKKIHRKKMMIQKIQIDPSMIGHLLMKTQMIPRRKRKIQMRS